MDNKLNILIYIKHFDLTPFTYNEILYLSKHHNVKVLCENVEIDKRFSMDYIIQFRTETKSLKCKINNFLIQHDLRLSYKSSKISRQFNDIIAQFKPDIIQCHYGDDALIFLDNINTLTIPIVIMFHGYDASAWLRNSTYVKKYKKYLNKPNIYAICCSENMKNRLALKGFSKEKITVVYYGTDINFYKREEYPDNKEFIFSQISVFRTKKGLEYTLHAFNRYLDKFQNKNFKLILAGDGELKGKIHELAHKLELSNFVEFPGWLNQQQAKELLEKTNVFVHHSITNKDGDMEGIPNVIIEAMAMELPVISTFHSGIPELVENTINGILIKEKDIEGYANAIYDIQKFSYLKENREKILERFELNQRNNDVNDIILTLTKNHEKTSNQ
ncbi:MAG: hypothetical protein COA57_01000 [Flavobacteriales bacterium]|nr:MAG: hypothetical protein COA57_01000 [Flavobacteriales bacterium]